MSTALLPYGQPLYWSFHERPEAWHIDPFHQYAKQLVFFGGGRFTNTTHFHDSSLYGNHGVLTNMTPSEDWVRELGRPALDLNGSSQYVVSQSATVFPSTNYTIAIWCNCGSQGTKGVIVQSPYGGALQTGIFVQSPYGAVHADRWYWQNYATGGDTGNSVSRTVNAWDHLCLSGNAGGFYVNGLKLATTGTRTGAQTSAIGLGYYWTSYLTGKVCDAMCWSRVLSPSEISALADPGNVMLSLGGSDPGLIVPDDLVYPVYLPSSIPAGAKPALWLGVCV